MMRYLLLLAAIVVLQIHPGSVMASEHKVVINPGLSGSWYSPETDGQGFVFEVVPRSEAHPNQFLVYWFTYALERGGPQAQRWMLAEGEFEWGASAVSLDVFQFTGGQFDQPDGVQAAQLGTAELSFEGCSNASLKYEINFDDSATPVAGSIALERLTPDLFCKSMPQVTLDGPETVAPGESFEVVYRIANAGPVDLVLFTPNSCIASVRVFRNGEPAEFAGERLVCLTVLTFHPLPAGETLEHVYELTAATTPPDSQPASPGIYTIQVDSEVRAIHGLAGTLPNLSRAIEVQ